MEGFGEIEGEMRYAMVAKVSRWKKIRDKESACGC